MTLERLFSASIPSVCFLFVVFLVSVKASAQNPGFRLIGIEVNIGTDSYSPLAVNRTNEDIAPIIGRLGKDSSIFQPVDSIGFQLQSWDNFGFFFYGGPSLSGIFALDGPQRRHLMRLGLGIDLIQPQLRSSGFVEAEMADGTFEQQWVSYDYAGFPLRLDAAYLLRTNPQKRWGLYGGIGINASYLFGGRIKHYYTYRLWSEEPDFAVRNRLVRIQHYNTRGITKAVSYVDFSGHCLIGGDVKILKHGQIFFEYRAGLGYREFFQVESLGLKHHGFRIGLRTWFEPHQISKRERRIE